jgi:hypothetical protein
MSAKRCSTWTTQASAPKYIGEKLAVPRERAEASGVVDEGDDTPSFNYDDPAEREAAIDLAASGETVCVHDATDLEGD